MGFPTPIINEAAKILHFSNLQVVVKKNMNYEEIILVLKKI